MNKEQLQNGLDGLKKGRGEWLYDVALPFGLWTNGQPGLAHTRLKRIVQAISDLIGKPLHQCRILDLGSLEGLFSIELGQHGASVVGIEIRQVNVERAQFLKEVLELERVSFVQEDVRHITPEKYGTFDAIVCSGILYHLDADAAIALIHRMYDMADRLVVIDTHIALRADTGISHGGETYCGRFYTEHSPSDDEETRTANRMASADNEHSFWFTRPSLVNLLSRAGFSSVYECFTPAHLNFGRPGFEHLDRCTFVALKEDKLNLVNSPAANDLVENWPEGSLAYAPTGRMTRLGAVVAHRVASLFRR